MIRRLLVLLALASPCWAALQRDLGAGLSYTRISDLAADNAAVVEALQKPNLILDLRYTTSDQAAAAALSAQLDATTPPAGGVRIILLNASTAAPLVAVFEPERPRELSIGPASPAVTLDIPVTTTPEDDRRAFDALASGTPVEKLISSNTDKRRFDEATLARNRSGDSSLADEDNQEPPPEVAEAAKKEAAPPHDSVLERAVQVARALPILRRAH